MIDENIDKMPYKKGDKLILEITVIDEDKVYDFLCKSILCKPNAPDKELGFSLDLVSFWKDRYINNTSEELKKEIINTLQKSIDDIKNLTGV